MIIPLRQKRLKLGMNHVDARQRRIYQIDARIMVKNIAYLEENVLSFIDLSVYRSSENLFHRVNRTKQTV
jgi:hypothetical protein